MRLALERKRRLALVTETGYSLLGVIKLGTGAGRSVLALAVADEYDGRNDEDDEHADAGDDGDDGC